MDFFVEMINSKLDIIREETFVGVASLAGLFLQLSRDLDLGDDIESVHINRIREAENG
jgi:hypothetical protein